ncbi:protein O-mannosyl-transferase 2-like isoform X2 [Eriocheir sinensis]|uniref:protein O-mannosyl-transferase 2-like isoform X2 n=1 Tax=Eriocheir sinensis TaxID=95602 RepID=UPI0021CAAB80|nr:protein O-mannosyl-transferase 2-like isoform X2 [Eriocheir sinensis]
MASETSKKSKDVRKSSTGNLTVDKIFAKYRTCDSAAVWWAVFGVVCALTAATRFYNVGQPEHVVWDETHFGKFGSWYINRTFFFDVHPPLGKMLIGAFGYMTGYDGTFPFVKPGDSYEGVNYLGMRVCCTAMGACLVPFAFIIVWEMTQSLPAATFASSLILFDIGLLTLTQYILLDPILLFFIMGSVVGCVKFHAQRHRAFGAAWWGWLSFTGVMLSGSVSTKFVGLFVVVYVGLHTIATLWDIYGDLKNPLTLVAKHFLARALGLILLPIILYCVYFYIHLTILCRSGNGDGFYSSAFQSQLEGNSLYNASMPLELAFGAEVTLKNARTGGGYLHSHIHLYPEGVGARQQQITTYSHKDFNNRWLVKKWNAEPADWDDEEAPIELVKNGDLVRLEHVPTGRNLHSHREPAPVTKRHHQITGYGENGEGDVNDVWRVEVEGGAEGEVVKTVVHRLRFIHYLVGCALMSHNKQLPKWGYEQMEVTCNPNVHDTNNLWNIEDNQFPKLPNSSFEIYAPNFLEKFLESHTVMFQGNSGLKPKEGEITSQPWQWPINFKGQWFSAIDGFKVYLLGHPLIWWGNLVILAAFLLLYCHHAYANKRGTPVDSATRARRARAMGACGWLVLAWALHYLPFYAMGRILYFHHYFPALLFSSMLTGVMLDYLFESLPDLVPGYLSSSVYPWLTGVFYSGLAMSFYLFSPLAYGMHNLEPGWANHTIHALRWLDTWEF